MASVTACLDSAARAMNLRIIAPHVALVEIAGMNSVENDEDSSRLSDIGRIRELARFKLGRRGWHLPGGREVLDGPRFTGIFYGEIGFL